jgi:hypothetical protein
MGSVLDASYPEAPLIAAKSGALKAIRCPAFRASGRRFHRLPKIPRPRAARRRATKA